MTKLPNLKKPTFTLQLRCSKCGRFIEIECVFAFRERAEFGAVNYYRPKEKLPLYLLHMLQYTQDQFEYKRGLFKSVTNPISKPTSPPVYSSTNPMPPICKNCRILEQLETE